LNVKQGKHRGWRYLAIASIVFLLGTGAWFLLAPIQQAKQLEHKVVDRFGWANRYTPPADGLINPERLEHFIQVREAVQDNCRAFQDILDDVIKIENIESDPGMPTGDKVSEGIDSFKSMFGAVPALVAFMDTRNSALLNGEMGLGEYIYIYLSAYAEQLALESQGPYAGQDEAHLSPRARKAFVQILDNQLAALRSADQDEAMHSLAAALRAEMVALEDGSHATPWPDGPPANTVESLAPYRERLSRLYCKGIVRVELLQKNKGFNFDG
jgi:hypothetical protein